MEILSSFLTGALKDGIRLVPTFKRALLAVTDLNTRFFWLGIYGGRITSVFPEKFQE